MVDLSEMLVVGVTSRALFNLEKENEIYEREGVKRYREYQEKIRMCRLRSARLFHHNTFFPLFHAHRLRFQP